METPRLVLDTNCLIDLEEGRPAAVYIERLVTAYRGGDIRLAVGAISASENQPGAQQADNYQLFLDRLQRVGLGGAEQLLPLATWDVGFWDHMLWPSAELDQQAESIRLALFPTSASAPSQGPQDNRRWRNRHCDAMLAWCCIYHGWLELVTSDDNFHHRKARLVELGLRDVWTPQDAAARYAA
jgi:hypothetical protein